jgi:hypothetical protein
LPSPTSRPFNILVVVVHPIPPARDTMFSTFVYLGLAASAVVARPAFREVVAPPITFPTASTVWTVGQKTHVDWSMSLTFRLQHVC